MMDLSAYCVWYLLLTSTVAGTLTALLRARKKYSIIQGIWYQTPITMRNNYCSANKFLCTSGMCIHESWRCDGWAHCPDGLDESSFAGCETIYPDLMRLVNGTGPYGGRVEVSINGILGSISGYYFDMVSAKFLCRMVNLQATYFMRWAYFGQGTGLCYGMLCNRTETCEFHRREVCSHHGDISILCTKCPEIKVHGGEIVDVSADGTELTVKCYREFTSSTCIDGKWSLSPIICEAVIEEIRLTNGEGLYDGILEVSINGTWGPVCTDISLFADSTPPTICKLLFGTRVLGVANVRNKDETRLNPLIGRLDCSGSESNINQCIYSPDVSSWFDQIRLYVECSAPESTSTEAGTQLVQHSHETKSALQTTSESTTRSHDYDTTYSRSYISTKISDTSEPESTPTKSESLLGNDEVILIACVSAGILVVGILVVIVCCKRITRNVGAQNVNDGTTAVGELHNNTSPENIEMNEAGPGGVHVNLYESLSGRSERAAGSMINDYSNLYVSLADRNETEYTNRNEYDTLHLYADCQ